MEKEKIERIISRYRGQALKELRVGIGYSIEEFANLIGTYSKHLSLIEEGSTKGRVIFSWAAQEIGISEKYFDLRAMVLAKKELSPALRTIANRLEPLLDELVANHLKEPFKMQRKKH